MAFNLTSWSKRGRNFGRGAPPPPGSLEYVGVGDMFYGRAPAPRPAPTPRPVEETSSREPEPSTPPTASSGVEGPTRAGLSPSSIVPAICVGLAGAAYLGLEYLRSRSPRAEPAGVAVPDAYPEDEEE